MQSEGHRGKKNEEKLAKLQKCGVTLCAFITLYTCNLKKEKSLTSITLLSSLRKYTKNMLNTKPAKEKNLK